MALFTSSRSRTELLGWKRSSWLSRRDLERQVRELHVENQILQYWSSRDALTGTATRPQLDLVLEHQWRCAIIGASPVALLLIAVDRFNSYVEDLGQQAGNACLKQVACALSSALNCPGALLGRYEPARFLAVLPRTASDAAVAAAKVLRATVEGWRIPHPHCPVSSFVTISAGVASVTPREQSKPASLIAHAEQALTEAQQRGGNRVTTLGVVRLPSCPPSPAA